MCGIFGLILKSDSGIPTASISPLLRHLALSSESRGKDSSGLAFIRSDSMDLVKGDIRIGELIKSEKFNQFISQAKNQYRDSGKDICILGHARLVTNGSQLQVENNQPVQLENDILVHNGIVVNADQLWKEKPEWTRHYKIDTEIILKKLQEELIKEKKTPQEVLRNLDGTYSIIAFFASQNRLLLATNNGSLYYLHQPNRVFIVASESFYLSTLIQKSFGKSLINIPIKKLNAGESVYMDLKTLDFVPFEFKKNPKQNFNTRFHSIQNSKNTGEVVLEPEINFNRNKEKKIFDLLEFNIDRIQGIKRCAKCILPETFPFIHFDHDGVCNYCHGYISKAKSGKLEQLKEIVNGYINPNGSPDCIIPFSGGRDSTFALHMAKNELGLNPIAFTYDWGMVTDLARRNIARVCGKLGVENIVVAADIHWKRQNIRKNIEAWLKSPSLGMIPLFMAGDKYFFYYTDRLKKQTGINLNIWGVNHLENTDFKVGFAGLAPQFEKEHIYSLSRLNQLKLLGFVGKEFLSNPKYLNQSLIDTFGSFAVRYLAPKKDYYQLFDYYPWNENEINTLIQKEYDWEKATDTNSTWRIGDGTAGFYNYIYYTVAGFSEVDTFRSNQIREGMMSREEALEKAIEENQPRFESIRWYLEILGLDFEKTLQTINSIPKLYLLKKV
ncbi:glucosamine 6-phosphate synthetase [Aquiflexum lacus]|uniref:glucosamine 6-phosphate synthetase n=1 Tax=Aquiflexum lacus TaxID=2483805 RepID=UPI001895A816|nr:glucosamine 6-phosphate synthetase [Aquiflexum lacus]